jgi:hypothetical protein
VDFFEEAGRVEHFFNFPPFLVHTVKNSKIYGQFSQRKLSTPPRFIFLARFPIVGQSATSKKILQKIKIANLIEMLESY